MSLTHAYRQEKPRAPIGRSAALIQARSDAPAMQSASSPCHVVSSTLEPLSDCSESTVVEVGSRWLSSSAEHDGIVALARTLLVDQIDQKIVADELAKAACVSESTLRRVILAETGLKLASFIMNIKLDQAHVWLSSNRESRTLSRITAALGLKSISSLSRAYRRRFGEAMSETRRRAVNTKDPSSK